MTFTTEELNQIMLGLLNQHVALRDSVKNTRDLPEVCAHWTAKLQAVETAYNKVQEQYLKQSTEDLLKLVF